MSIQRHVLPFVFAAAMPLAALPAQAAADAKALAACCNRFAAALHERFAAQGAPTASPASIALVLCMLLPGAAGDTKAELEQVLQLPEDLRGARLHAAAKNLLAELGIGGAPAHEAVTLRLANDLWTQPEFRVLSAYSTQLRDAFGSQQHAVDFRKDPAAARTRINAHVAEITNDRIPELLPADVVTAATRVVLTNAIWLKAPWFHEFTRAATQPAPFTLTDGTKVDVPTMRTTAHFAWAEAPTWQCVALPFAGGRFVCELVVAEPGALPAAERELLAGRITAKLATEDVAVHLPRFRVAAARRLRETLQQLGLAAAFDPARADFTGISPERGFVLDEVVHQTWIQVDEDGAEAAAATAAVMRVTAAVNPTQPKVWKGDRPFAFVLRDRATGLILFVGRVDDPRHAPGAAQPPR
jgi:serpin B